MWIYVFGCPIWRTISVAGENEQMYSEKSSQNKKKSRAPRDVCFPGHGFSFVLRQALKVYRRQYLMSIDMFLYLASAL